jgi:mannosylglucosylglycerate synthase
VPEAVLVSYRLGGTDGVSIEAAKWAWALGRLGFSVRRVAGVVVDPEPGDCTIPELALDATAAPGTDDVDAALAGADLVVVENLCSLPLHPEAGRAVATVLARSGVRTVLHHHDLASQRAHLAHLDDFPPDLPGALHVTINDLSRAELATRGIAATTIRNHFDLDAPLGDRAATRALLGVPSDAVVVWHPVRAIARKGVPAALAASGRLDTALRARVQGGGRVHYWLFGPAEEGYGPELERVLGASPVPVIRHPRAEPADAYAACDVVAFPSTWEGFGNPVVESMWAGKPLIVADYPVLHELAALGFRWFGLDDVDALADHLAHGDDGLVRHNRAVARRHLDLRELPRHIDAAFRAHGWTDW